MRATIAGRRCGSVEPRRLDRLAGLHGSRPRHPRRRCRGHRRLRQARADDAAAARSACCRSSGCSRGGSPAPTPICWPAGRYAPAARFFLEELYGDKDYSRARRAVRAHRGRDREAVSRRTWPAPRSALAQLHALTEDLDMQMARSWRSQSAETSRARAATSWLGATVGRRGRARARSWTRCWRIGRELARLTRHAGPAHHAADDARPRDCRGTGSICSDSWSRASTPSPAWPAGVAPSKSSCARCRSASGDFARCCSSRILSLARRSSIAP